MPTEPGGHPFYSTNVKEDTQLPGASGHQNTEATAQSPRCKDNDMMKHTGLIKKSNPNQAQRSEKHVTHLRDALTT